MLYYIMLHYVILCYIYYIIPSGETQLKKGANALHGRAAPNNLPKTSIPGIPSLSLRKQQHFSSLLFSPSNIFRQLLK